MAKSFNLELQTRPTKQGTYPVWIRITENRKHRRIKTSIELNRLSDWNPKGKPDSKIRKSEEHYQQWNECLEKELGAVKDLCNAESNKGLSISSLAQTIKEGEKSESFIKFLNERIEDCKHTASVSTYRNYKTAVRKVEDYIKTQGLDDISFKEIDLAFINKFSTYLGGLENSRTKQQQMLKKSSISKTLRILRTLVLIAVAEGHIEKSPFGKGQGKFRIKADAGSKKEKLTAEEIDKIMELELEQGSWIWHTRNAFLFSFCCAGIRAGDLLQLRWENVEAGDLSYQMDKNGKIRNYSLEPEAEAILDYYRADGQKASDYIFPFLNSDAEWAIKSYKGTETMTEELKRQLFNQVSSKNVTLNKNLKKIAELAGIDKKVTFHTSRHSFANLAMKSNLPPSMTQKLLGHSSVKTTEIYMGNFSSPEASEAIHKVLSQLNTQKGQKGQNEAVLEALKGLDKETLISLLTEAITNK